MHAADEADEEAWFRTAWLASAVRGTIWGQRGISPWELLGWQPPTREIDDAQNAQLWAQMVSMVTAAERGQ